MKSFDAVVIGAGIIGAAIAYFLSREGLKVLVLDRSTPASGTSGACDGVISLHSKTPGLKIDMAREGIHLYNQLSLHTDLDLEMDKKGSICLAETEEEVVFLKKRMESQKGYGLDVRLLDPEEIRSMEPLVSDQVIGASWCPEDTQINPIMATFAFLESARDKGCVLRKNAPVTSLLVHGTTLQGVMIGEEKISAEWTINACGAEAAYVSEMIGIAIPIQPRRGQLLVTEPVDPVISSILLEARYMAFKNNPALGRSSEDPALKAGISLSVEQTRSGSILIGGTREFAGYNRKTSYDAFHLMAERAIHFLPSLRELRIIRSFAGLRPYTPDGMPIIGPVEGIDGFLLAAGHEGDGIALAPSTGKMVSQMVCGKSADFPLELFSLSRFKSS
ncbi:MAG: FAD-binding oxidoreductase [Synergistales bacterium]|nr:FAD-binding oxidoreductase [Synergistales bacterium]